MSEQEARLEALTPALAGAVAGMTFPAYRHLLRLEPCERHPGQPDQRPIEPLGSAAFQGNDPIGLALAEMPLATPREAEVLSLFVAPEHRGRGVATALLAHLESQLARRGVREVKAVYMTGRPAIDALERVIAKRGWAPPSARTVTLRFTPEEALRTPWFSRIRLSEEYQTFPWTQLRPEERDELQRSQAETGWIAAGLEPWRHDQDFDRVSSVGLRYRGTVVGWVINHRIAPDTVRFTCSFMRRDLGRRGRILPLYTASIERLRGTECRYCTFVTPVLYRSMVEFVRKRCAPWASFFGETRGTSKRLGAELGADLDFAQTGC